MATGPVVDPEAVARKLAAMSLGGPQRVGSGRWRRRSSWSAAAGVVAAACGPRSPRRPRPRDGAARCPAARELAALGFAIERLRLAAGERVQLVAARRL
jgi:hypothetical protein